MNVARLTAAYVQKPRMAGSGEMAEIAKAMALVPEERSTDGPADARA